MTTFSTISLVGISPSLLLFFKGEDFLLHILYFLLPFLCTHRSCLLFLVGEDVTHGEPDVLGLDGVVEELLALALVVLHPIPILTVPGRKNQRLYVCMYRGRLLWNCPWNRAIQLGLSDPSGLWVQYPDPVVPSTPRHARWIILALSTCIF